MESGRLFFGCNSSNMLFLGNGNGDNYFRGNCCISLLVSIFCINRDFEICLLILTPANFHQFVAPINHSWINCTDLLINSLIGTRMGFNMEESSKKRPFLSSIDDMLEEEYYDEQLTEKKRRLSPEQVLIYTIYAFDSGIFDIDTESLHYFIISL